MCGDGVVYCCCFWFGFCFVDVFFCVCEVMVCVGVVFDMCCWIDCVVLSC